MRKTKMLMPVCFLLFLIFAAGAGCRRKTSTPKNIILIIIDGGGFNHVAATSLFQYGETGRLSFEPFPVRLAVSTDCAKRTVYDPEQAWESWDFVRQRPTDSAAAATAIAAGKKTIKGFIGMDSRGNRLPTIVDYAERMGKATGVVTSVQFAHATPAAFLAHNSDRENYPEISREIILSSPVDVVMGCGHPEYLVTGKKAKRPFYDYVGGKDTWDLVTSGRAGCDADGDGAADFWRLVESRDDFIRLMDGTTPSRVLGIPLVRKTLQQEREGNPMAPPLEVAFNENVPTLEEMSRAALNILSRDPDGFFLMIEGGAVDWAAHDLQLGRMIEEQLLLDQAVAAVCEWISSQSSFRETLVIVTSDHETGYLWGPGSGRIRPAETSDIREVWRPLENHGRGRTPGMSYYDKEHTNSLVPFYAKGPGSRLAERFADESDPVRGAFLDNTEIAQWLFTLWK